MKRSNGMTYTLVCASTHDGVTLLIGSPRDGDKKGIEDAIASHREMESEYLSERDADDPLRYRPAEIELIPGCTFSDEEPETGEIVWSGSEGGWLMDEHGTTYKFASVHAPLHIGHTAECVSGKSEWSGSPNPDNPDEEWICDECGGVISDDNTKCVHGHVSANDCATCGSRL